ncbi:MAG TPA: phosphatidylserine/phosphatidylglycerophosphate/cardiolipin synthase family protein [Candidatus Limnocylindrales bacterium]|nr:phosphatidylserine/phosphatidylglycerophosphate/cardiolipin synthase family protein [Candidatus Limnocylindrales bacterium]
MLTAIEEAQQFICLETYIYSPDALGDRFRDALCRAQRRGVRVRVLLDALGSYGLSGSFWKPLEDLGGEVRRFNPLSLYHLGIRNHRKVLTCDGKLAFVGGFNISSEYEGDGINCGWCDLGLRLEGPLVGELTASFEEMYKHRGFRHQAFISLRRSHAKKTVVVPHEQLLLSGPGRGYNPIKRAIQRDLARAGSVQIMVGYFLPTWRLRRLLARIPRVGGRVQLILAGKSDVLVSRLASQSLYRRLFKSGIEIYEYQPQILHAKLFIIDDLVYVGSSNLDPRSLNINYELMVRLDHAEITADARAIFAKTLEHCRRITPEEWSESRSLWNRLKQRWAYLLLVRLDPYIARRQWRER